MKKISCNFITRYFRKVKRREIRVYANQVKYDRSKLCEFPESTDRRTYKILLLKKDPYDELSYLHDGISSLDRRQYRSWKYNRKTHFKDK